jgi:hypothetical protein
MISKNILSIKIQVFSGIKTRFFSDNFAISQFVVGKVVNPCPTRDSRDFGLSLVKSLSTISKIGFETNRIRSWYSYQRNLKSFYQRDPKNPRNPCGYWLGEFTNEMAKKVSLVKFLTQQYQGSKGENQNRASTLYINIYGNPP